MMIKKATEKDILSLSRIHAKSWKRGYQGIVPESYLQELQEDAWVVPFQTWLREKSLECAMAFLHEKPVGVVSFGKGREKGFEHFGEIVSCYVLPVYFRQGIGEALLTYAMKVLTEQGWSDCYLWVLEENARGRKFYEAMGFYDTGDCCEVEIGGKQLKELRYCYKIIE